jgi:acetoin:2,6-dichlorophenolindophenol oxidoreductase subunit beta
MCSVRRLSFSLAINEALHQAMAEDPTVILIGQGVKSPWYVGNTCQGLLERFGEDRVIDTPVSENAITGGAVGAAIAGLRPVVVHPRMDFMFFAMDPILNQAANWHYMNGGASSVPVVFWGIINRGGEQAAQHSQAIHAMFSHAPGLKVVMPATAYDAKGLMIAAIRDPDPVVFVDERWLYADEDDVPEEPYTVPVGQGVVRNEGDDVTLVAISYMLPEAMKACEELKQEGISVELVDPRTIKPLDKELVLKSLRKTGRLVVADVGWKSFGVAAEVCAIAVEEAFSFLKAPAVRVALPDCPAPATRSLETAYYPRSVDIGDAIRRIL